MRSLLSTTWFVRIAVMVFISAMFFVVSATAVTVHDDHHAPIPICEHIEWDDQDAIHQECITLAPRPAPRDIVDTTQAVLIPPRFASVILQPPETV